MYVFEIKYKEDNDYLNKLIHQTALKLIKETIEYEKKCKKDDDNI